VQLLLDVARRLPAALRRSTEVTGRRESARGCASSKKRNREKLVWLHREAEEFLDAHIGAADISEPQAPLFQTLDKAHRLTGEAITRRDMLRVVKARCRTAGLSEAFCNHTFRGTGITVFLHNGGALEGAQDMANHSDPRTTKLYDRRKDLATLSEIERRIAFE
jgi:site-specific recombinase XerD